MNQSFDKCSCGNRADRTCRKCSKKVCNGCMSTRFQCFSCVSNKRRETAADLLERTRKFRMKAWSLQDKWRDHAHETIWDGEYRDNADKAVKSLDEVVAILTKIMEGKKDDEQSTATK